jgi:cytochrome c
MDDRFNTIAGWTLFAGIIALGSSIVASEMFHAGRPEKMGYPIAGVETEGEGGGEAAKPIEFYLAQADVTKGQSVFNKCTACHTADKGGPNGVGPNLYGIMGEGIGKGHGFAFSSALSGHGGTWDWNTLSEWLSNPKAFAPGTKMTFAGISNPQDRANVIAFLNSKSDSPLPLPAAPAEEAAPADANAAADANGAADANAAAPADANAAAPAEANAAAPKAG